MKKSLVLGLFLVLLSVAAYAQLDWMVTDLKCGNGKLDQFELCEEGVETTRCEIIGEMLKVATACDTDHCTCLPRVIKTFCGNDIREGIELCDGESEEDLCPEFGKRINLTLECNAKCGCDIIDTVPEDYNPEYLQQLDNESKKEAVCGDKQVDGAEQCDPPGTLCTTNLDEPGECSDKCICEILVTEKNETEQVNETVPEKKDEIKVHQLNETEKEAESEPGFFTKIWNWIVSLFS
ncbi:hypothetical protein KY329_00695 [Candidatus Woesearchaeota archaeon]|nr:hypothetical protein [Candidatus Woesearchaeota archaeon]